MKIRLTESKFRYILTEMVQEILTETKMSLEDVYNNYYSNIDKNIFLAAVNADPTSKRTDEGKLIGIGVYTKWLLNLVRKGSWKPSDAPETTYSLTTYHKLKNQLPLDKRDINLFKSVPELYNFVEELSPTKSRSEIKHEGAEKVYEDEQWKIIIPHTKEAACFYGKNTEWCTAATQSDNMFDYYNNQGSLYINIDHVNNRKYQFHFERNQFMDEHDEPVDPLEIGLSEGAINYYKSIGKAKYFLTIKDIQTYIQQGDFSIFDKVQEKSDGLKLCYLNFKPQVYLIKSNGEIIGNTGFKEIYPQGNVFEVQNNNYLYSFVIQVGNDYKLITNEQDEELWFRDIIKMFTYGKYFKVQNNEGLYSLLIPVDDGREGKYKLITNEQGEELWFDYMNRTDNNGIKVTKYNDENNKKFKSLLVSVGNDYKLITDEYGEELWFDEIKSYYNDFTVIYNDNTMWGYLIPVSDGRDGKYKIVSLEEFRQYERQRTSLNEMINRLVRNYRI